MKSNDFLATPIEYLKNVGPQRADLLKLELEIFNFGGLLEHFPFRYIDKSKYHSISQITNYIDHPLQFKGTLQNISHSLKSKRLTATLVDSSGKIELIWFKGGDWVKSLLTGGGTYIVFGKPSRFKGKWSIAHPEVEKFDAETFKLKPQLQPVYSSTEKLNSRGLHSKGIQKLVENLVAHPDFRINEILPEYLSSKLKFPKRSESYKNIHLATNLDTLERSRFHLKFEELFVTQIQILKVKHQQEKNRGFLFPTIGEYFNEFYNTRLKFELTGAQKKVIKEIRRDLSDGLQMNRLLQGDVGSGKTVVALLIALIAIDNDFQVTLLAPTEILAQQHYASFIEALDGLEVTCELLTGSTKKSVRNKLFPAIEEGRVKILIGTHAILEDKVKFKNLGLAIIDEQHRFGVAQRARLWNKSKTKYPHVLVMTATPIPRTLAMTFYGDLDISVIDELPPGRKEIKTIHLFDNSRLKMLGFIQKEIDKGRQAYIVYPLIEESEKMDYKYLEDGYESLSRFFPKEKYQLGVLHGRMKPADKAFEMNRFVKGESQLLVSTTVIEVGVNVPNASLMVIENAEKFGLSQLHQLRGRVGRGSDQSYCILMSGSKLTAEGKERLKTMVSSNDGFVIAEADLKLRGPGDLMGTQQSGLLHFKLADLIKDEKILTLARQEANELLNIDPDLEQDAHKVLNLHLVKKGKKAGWGQIS